MADAKAPEGAKQTGVSERIKSMQVGQFGTNLAAMLQMQTQVSASKAKPEGGAVKLPMPPRAVNRGDRIITLIIEAGKGSAVTLKHPESTLVNDSLNIAQTQLSLKNADRLGLYSSSSGIFLRGELNLKMHLLKDEEKLEIKARKDKGTFVKVFHRGKDEMELVEIYPSTTTFGLIQLLANKDADTVDQFGVYLANGTRLENDSKLSSVVKGTTVILEYRPNSMQVIAPNLPPPPPVGSVPLPVSSANGSVLPPPPPLTGPIPPPPPMAPDSPEENRADKDPQRKKLRMSAKPQKDKKKSSSKKSGIPEDSEYDNKVPPLRFSVVEQLVAYLDANGLLEVGLFRESAPLTEVKKLYAQFFNDKIDMSQVFDPHVAAGALKLYFREQPEALVPISMCTDYSEAFKAGQDNATLLKVIKEQFLPKLPQPNKNILHILLNLLSKLVKNEDKNRMSPNAVAICFAPTVIFDRSMPQTTTMMDFEASKWTVPFIVRLVENYEAIFAGVPLPTSVSSPLPRRNSSPAAPTALPPPPLMDMTATMPAPSPKPDPSSPRRQVTSMELPPGQSPKAFNGNRRPISVDMTGLTSSLVRAVSTNTIERPSRPLPPQGLRQSASQQGHGIVDPKAVLTSLSTGTARQKIDAATAFTTMKDDIRMQTYLSNLPPNVLIEILTNVTQTLSKCTAPSE